MWHQAFAIGVANSSITPAVAENAEFSDQRKKVIALTGIKKNPFFAYRGCSLGFGKTLAAPCENRKRTRFFACSAKVIVHARHTNDPDFRVSFLTDD